MKNPCLTFKFLSSDIFNFYLPPFFCVILTCVFLSVLSALVLKKYAVLP
jgi:hypothetical protein